jgi:thioredoxin reductase
MVQKDGMGSEVIGEPFDCIVIGAGPGGLQACIHLGRYNFRVLLFHRQGGRTHHAKHIENYLGLPAVSGKDLLEAGLAQVESFGVAVERVKVERVEPREGQFEVHAGKRPTDHASSSQPRGPGRASPPLRTSLASSAPSTSPA